ncbi:amine oxidase [Ascodesmis nigricans]|uniref:Amine oxidase n=1 Tax=Ascodesmis nigricans TaxID=341454 RepID=A0A4S2N1G1_9PEZI|nr:amine oxidase [Ascodesmis nigricans]
MRLLLGIGLISTFFYLTIAAEALETDVLILGGGMSGVSAAHTLNSLNVTDFLLLEARHELGGRVQNAKIGDISVEFGANWIQGLGSNPIWLLAEKYGVKNRYSNWSNIAYLSEKNGWNDEELEEAVTRFEEVVFDAASKEAGRRKELGLADLSMKAGLRLVGWDAKTPAEKAAEYFSHDWEMAETPLESSFIGTIESYNESFVESGNGDNNIVVDPEGYKQVVIKHAAEIPDFDQKVRFNEVVINITYSGEDVTVSTSSGLVVKARRAICTFSLGVLQHNDVSFYPPLPEAKRDAIMNFHLATYTKIFARFPRKFWNDTEFILYADRDDRGHWPIWQPLDIPGFYPGSGVLFATLTGDYAYRAEAQTDEELQENMMEQLRFMYGPDIPDPIEFKFPRWTLDPLFRGSFTNWGAGVTEKQQQALAAPVGGDTGLRRDDTLWFAGEHTSRKYFGYLHGAYWEGRLAAHRIADCIRSDGCTESFATGLVRRQAGEMEAPSGERRRMRKRMWE